jgi:hypothetical protein
LFHKYYVCVLGMIVTAAALAQVTKPATAVRRQSSSQSHPTTGQTAKKPKGKLSPQQQFVLDAVRSAVALPQPDPQDRLRVLTAAATVAGPVNPEMAKRYTLEGSRIEGELIAAGQKPAVSILSAGHFDCSGAVAFEDQVPATGVADAEQSLINVMTSCPKQATEDVRRKVEAGLDEGVLAPRALLALMDSTGPKSAWSQANFTKMFKTLSSDPESVREEAPNYAAMFNRMAPEVDKDVARDAGLRFLEWLSKLSDGGPKNIAVNMTADTLKQVLGQERYQDALSSNLMAMQVVNSTRGKPAEVDHPAEENVSVLAAMNEVGKDQTEALSKLAPSMRARQAAADGYASGTAGHIKTADRYFDIAFSALDEVWNNRADQKDAAAVVQEVCEAAGQVNAIAALKRAQGLGDPSAQAIGMLAVARVVLGQAQSTPAPPPQRANVQAAKNPIK